MHPALILAAAAADPAPPGSFDYSLPRPVIGTRIVPDCPRGAPGEIVVCGRRGDDQRLRGLRPPPGVEEPLPDGSFGIGLAEGVRLEAEQVTRPDGYRDTRVMVKVKIPF
jgi:hypothetical protein